jgi:hypothetical protein
MFFLVLRTISATQLWLQLHPFFFLSTVRIPRNAPPSSSYAFYPSGIWQLVFEPMAVSVGLATPLQGSALFHAGLFGWAKNLVVLFLVLPNHALLPQ